jgi:RNA polymerase sigma factor (TIGR02999 family)
VKSIAALIAAAEQGNRSAGETLFATLYSELHEMARRELARRGSAGSLGVTTLLHEAYLDISKRDTLAFPSQAQFMGYASRVMRGLIIDHAREQRAQKRGGQFEITTLRTDIAASGVDDGELAAIGEALEELAAMDRSLAELVDLKFFCGFTFVEIAAMRQVSERTVQRQWEKARIYLHRRLRSDLQI